VTLTLSLTVAVIGLGLATVASAQSDHGAPEDLEFEIVNATSNQPGSIERLVIEYSEFALRKVLDTRPEGSAFTVEAVPVKDIGKYIVTAWADGVPYFWSLRGSQLTDGPVVLHVFGTTTALENVQVAGLNVLIQRQESLLKVEYMLRVQNDSRPQATVKGSPATVELLVPPELTNITAEYTRGPEPIEVETRQRGERLGLVVNLTPGQNQIHVRGSLTWREGLVMKVGSNLPLAAWSLLTAPANLEARSFDLEHDTENQIPGYRRFMGPVLEADDFLEIELTSGQGAGPAEDLFEQTDDSAAPGEPEATADEQKGGGVPLPLLVLVPLLIIVIIIAARRRRQ